MVLNEISSNKKLSQFVDASTFIKWFKKRGEYIKKLLGVEELPDLEDIIQQSNGLISDVINRQSSGNRGGRTDFESFTELNKILIHDFLHNLYNATEKSFEKSLNDYEFSIDEIMEEIECLGIEESFMKYMNIPYLKRDFINQNINQLSSYMAVTFILEYPEDYINIITKKEKPFLWIDGKKMYLEGTAFEGVGDRILSIRQYVTDDYSERFIQNQEEFIDYLKDLLAVSDTINATNGDRAQLPDGNYYGDDIDLSYRVIQNAIWDRFYHAKTDQYTDKDSINVDDIVCLKKSVYINILLNEFNKIREKSNDGADEEDTQSPLTLEQFLEEYGNSRYDIDGFNFSFDEIDEKTFSSHVEGDNDDYIIVKVDTLEPIKCDLDSVRNYDYDYYELESELQNKVYDDHYGAYSNLNLDQLIKELRGNDAALSIFRRNFRSSDMVRNVTNNKYNGDNKDNFIKRNIDISNFFNTPFPSISKKLFTDKAKKLYILLYDFKGYIISNSNEIKSDFKKNKDIGNDPFLINISKYATRIKQISELELKNLVRDFKAYEKYEFKISFDYMGRINIINDYSLFHDIKIMKEYSEATKLCPELQKLNNYDKDVLSQYTVFKPIFELNLFDLANDPNFFKKAKISSIYINKIYDKMMYFVGEANKIKNLKFTDKTFYDQILKNDKLTTSQKENIFMRVANNFMVKSLKMAGVNYKSLSIKGKRDEITIDVNVKNIYPPVYYFSFSVQV